MRRFLLVNLLLMKCILIIFFVYFLYCVILKKMYPNRRHYQFNILIPYFLQYPPCGMMTQEGLRSTRMSVYLCCSMACFSPLADCSLMSSNLATAALDNLGEMSKVRNRISKGNVLKGRKLISKVDVVKSQENDIQGLCLMLEKLIWRPYQYQLIHLTLEMDLKYVIS